MPPPFVLFGRSHLIVLALTLVVPLVMAVVARASRSPTADRIFRFAFAAWLIGIWIVWFWLIFDRGWQSAQTVLPMHLCDWACIAVIVTMLTHYQRTYELAYFWALAGTLQGLLTPELAVGLPDLRAIVFFGFHGGVIAGVLYLTFGSRLRPYPFSIPRVIATTLIYAASAGLVDWAFHVNFGYLRAKPVEASVLDYLAPWPWYIAELIGIGLISIFVFYAPWFLADRLRGKISPAATAPAQ
jgi:hypothetical integral membrane protein (TIGR02206 family)